MEFRVPSLTIEQLLQTKHPVIDVRTEEEFNHFHIPGAYHVPLFTKEERAVVGTSYKQEGPEVAKEKGLSFVSPKLPRLYARIKEIYEKEKKSPVVHCWRGGMRSLSVVSMLNALGIPCYQLQGGIRAFRQKIVADLEEQKRRLPPFIVLEGYTGTGKTKILQTLKKNGFPVLDLESMAGHRGSIFGAIGMNPVSQKQFECRLREQLLALSSAPYMMIENESERIGRIVLPDFIIEQKKRAKRIRLHVPLETRIEQIYETYRPVEHRREIEKAIETLKHRLKPNIRQNVEVALVQNDYKTIIALLLEHYYDPKYEYARGKYETSVVHIDAKTPDEGAKKVREALGMITESRVS